MPTSITILCQIKSQGLDGGFINGLASYTVSPNTLKYFHYGFYKKQISLYLHDLSINDYALISGKCVFDKENMHIMVSTAFKLEFTENESPSTGPYISFVGKIYSRPKEEDNDCVFGINVSEYNNFSFTSKGKINFKIQVVFESGPDSHFRKLTPKLEIGKLIFIAGLLDLSDDDLPFVEAKEIDLLEDSINDHQNTSSRSLFSRTQKFKTNKTISIKKENQEDGNKEELKDNEVEYGSELTKQSSKRKNELADLSLQRLKQAKSLDKNNNEESETNNNEGPSQPVKRGSRKKGSANNKSLNKTTKVTTRSQKQDKKEIIIEDDTEDITE